MRLRIGLISAGCALMFALCAAAQPAASGEVRAHLERAQRALATNDFAAAEREFAAILTLEPNNPDARANVGAMKFFQHDWSGAARELRRASEGRAPVPKVQALLGLCERRLGRTEESRRLLTQALPTLPEGALQMQAGLELVEMLYQTRDLEQAADALRILRRAKSPSADVLYATARVYADLANDSRDALLAAAPDSAQMHLLMAQTLVNRGDARGAVAKYRKALELDPKLRGAHFELGEAILADSRNDVAYDAAEKEFRAALAENPSDANAEYRLGQVHSLRGDFKAAIEHFERAIRLQPDHAYAHLELGAAWMKTGETAKAADELAIAARLNPSEPSVHYRLATLYRKQGRTEDAVREIAAYRQLREKEKHAQEIYDQMRQARRENLFEEERP